MCGNSEKGHEPDYARGQKLRALARRVGHFEKASSCPFCSSPINSTQTKAFDCTLSNFHIRNCVAHAEDNRVVKEELFCNKCSKYTGQHVYIAVFRGILIGVADSLQEAKEMIDDMNLEKLILWHHDLYKKYDMEIRENGSVLRFLRNVVEWFEQGRHKKKKSKAAGIGDILFLFDKEYLRGSKDPLEAIKRYLWRKKQKEDEKDD